MPHRHALLLLTVLAREIELPATMVVLYNSDQRRSAPLLDCDECTFVDVATGNLPPAADILYIDGHSVPPLHVVGLSLADLQVYVRRIKPRIIVANTCLFAEVHVLAAVFAESRRLERVLASPTRLPWSALSWSPMCADRRSPGPECFEAHADVFEYTRDFVGHAVGDVPRLTDQAKRCERPARVLDFGFLRYLRLDLPLSPPLLFQFPYDQIPKQCRVE